MSKKAIQSRSETLKMLVTVFFVVGLVLCYGAQQSVLAFIILMVGMLAGNAAREAKYQQKAEDGVLVDALRESVVTNPNAETHEILIKPHKSYGDDARDYARDYDALLKTRKNGQGRS